MKKLIAILVVFAVVTGAAFAQVGGSLYIGAWGKIVAAPLMIQTPTLVNGEKLFDDDGYGEALGARTFVGVGPDWGAKEIGGSISVSGSAEAVGFNMEIDYGEGAAANIFGNIWAKPFNGSDAFKITVGRYYEDTLRGKVGPGGRNSGWVLGAGWMSDLGQHTIFGRLGTGPDGSYAPLTSWDSAATGFMFSSVPVDGLFIAWNVNMGDMELRNGTDARAANNRRANDAFRGSQVAIGYNIPNIGLVRAQYLGGWAGKLDLTDPDSKAKKRHTRAAYKPNEASGAIGRDEQASIQVAFNLTAIDGINIDIGYRGWLPITAYIDDDPGVGIDPVKNRRSSQGHWIAAGADMTFGSFNLNIFGAAGFGGYTSRIVNSDTLDLLPYKKDRQRNGLDLYIKLDPSINLDFGTIGFSLGYTMKGSTIVWNSDLEKFTGKTYNSVTKENKYVGYTHQIGMGLWYERGLGSGAFSIALTYTMPELKYSTEHEKAKFNGSHWIQIPISLTYSFF